LTFIVAKFKALDTSFLGLIKSIIIAAISLAALRGLSGGITALGKALVNRAAGREIFSIAGAGGGATSAAPTVPTGGAPAPGGSTAAGGTGFMQNIDAKKLLAGAAAMVIAAAALYVTAKAVQEFMKVDWKAMGMAGAALVGLVGAVYILGKIATAGAEGILAGAAAMIVIGGALYVVALALKVAGEGMATFAPAFGQFGTALGSLDVLKMAAFGPAAAAFGIGLGILSLAAIPASLGLTVLANRLENFSASATAIQTLATSFNTLADALERIGEVDTAKLKDISKLASTVPPTARTAVTVGGGAAAGDNSELIRKVDELIRTLKEAKTVINIDNKVQQTPRVAMAGVSLRNDRG
jgi:hypothetical protein